MYTHITIIVRYLSTQPEINRLKNSKRFTYNNDEAVDKQRRGKQERDEHSFVVEILLTGKQSAAATGIYKQGQDACTLFSF